MEQGNPGDLIARAYAATYLFPVIITRSCNNYGLHQNKEKLIPRIISLALQNKRLPLYGDGKQVRDWLHGEDHLAALEAVLFKGRPGEIYNIGGSNPISNIELVKQILQRLDKPQSLITHVPDRLDHDVRYALNFDKIAHKLGWQAKTGFADGLQQTIEWYLDNKDRL